MESSLQKRNRKILLISHIPYDKNLYHHLKCFCDYMNDEYDFEYFYYPERGYWIDEFYDGFFKISKIRGNIKHIAKIIISDFKLFQRRKKYFCIIANDNYGYIKADRIFKKEAVVLWSFDFVSQDQKKSKRIIFQNISRRTKEGLTRNRKIIIQDGSRLDAFCRSIDLNDIRCLDPFLLSVSINPPKDNNQHVSETVLLQIGGINENRSGSESLLEEFQKENADYELYLHGYFSRSMINKIDISYKLPITSSISLRAKQVSKVINKCSIGFIFYEGDDENFYFINHASGQLVEYLCAGKPIIVGGNSNLGAYIEEKGAGKAIHDFSELNGAIKSIKENYSQYSYNAYNLFQREYCFLNEIKGFKEWLEG